MTMGIFALPRPEKTNAERRSWSNPAHGRVAQTENDGSPLMPEDVFLRVLGQERRRSERSRQRFVLMLLHAGELLQGEQGEALLQTVTKTVVGSTRETDLYGWYERNSVIGVICTETGSARISSILCALETRVLPALQKNLPPDGMNAIRISFHVYPDDLDLHNGGRPADMRLYPDLAPQGLRAKASQAIKRTVDIVGGLSALTLLSPIFALIAIAIKLTSRGPIFFKQPRLGRYGVRFTFLKFRSMYFQSDPRVHQEYVRRLITGEKCGEDGRNKGVYKMRNDPRVTPLGRFLRMTSLDELPQIFNVLRGEMSLVGPRPPIPYEVEAYDLWHRRRFLEAKPGITGLWQIEGRSRVKFAEMVRMDLRYVRTWTPWLDIKILLRTPWAMFRGTGAY
jgi:lipopolysaccharide/colanic/teichoic acid biosynthesis glycosyltransferase